MGRGDKRTTKGKRFKGSYGNSRPQRVKSATPVKAAAKKTTKKEPKEKPVKKAATKKAAKKKAG